MRRALVAGLLGVVLPVAAHAQPSASPVVRRPTAASPPIASLPTNLRSRIGVEPVTRLLHGDADDRLRGVERALAIGTPESIGLLADAIEHERAAALRSDPRALLAIARGLARFADGERARAALLAIVATANPSVGARRGEGAEMDPLAQTELARETAALAIARSGNDKAFESLYALARGAGSGQTAAMLALGTHPPREPGFYGNGAGLGPNVLRLLGQLGDLRALEILHTATRSPDVATRCAALVALAELGDERAVPIARAAIAETDGRLRAASGEAFVLLGAPERFKATAAILADDATAMLGLKLAERVHDPGIRKLVAARTRAPDRDMRTMAIRVLGRSPDPDAAKALVDPKLLGDRENAYLALASLARSPAPNAGALLVGLLGTPSATLAARAYVVRAAVRGDRPDDGAVFRLATSSSPTVRAVGVFARVALGKDDADTHLRAADMRIRRAAAMGALARPRTSLLGALATERDAATRTVLAVGLNEGDPDGVLTTTALLERARSGGGDAPLATYALVRRAEPRLAREVDALLGAGDPVLRAHAARGLASATLPDATGRLAAAYAVEADVDVRRALVGALAARTQDERSPARRDTLAAAATVDPDATVRQLAQRIPHAIPPLKASGTDAAWLRVTLADGNAPGDAFTGSVVGADGVAVPILFDDEGFAVVLGLPPGEARLVLAPRLPADKARVP